MTDKNIKKKISFFNKDKKQLEGEDLLREEAIQSPSKAIAKKFFRNKLGIIGLVGFISIVLLVFIGSKTIPFNQYYEQAVLKNISPGTGYLNIPDKLKEEGIEEIAPSVTFTAAVSKAGKFYIWGKNYENVFSIPADIQKRLDSEHISHVAAGPTFIIVANDKNEIFGWGTNAYGESQAPSKNYNLVLKEGVKKLVAGDLYSAVLTNEGRLITWGGVKPSKLNIIPKAIQGHITNIEASILNILAMTDDGKIHVLGIKSGELGTELPKDLAEGKIKIVDIALTEKNGLALGEDGKLYQWGSNIDSIPKPPEGNFKEIEGGRVHFTALDTEGKMYAWGADKYGETKAISGTFDKLASGYFINYAINTETKEVGASGLDGFTFGTDQRGRDQLTRLIHGGATTLFIALVAVSLQVIIGVIIGMIAGFYGGLVDNLLMRFAEIIASFPFYPLVITISAALPVDTSQDVRILIIMILLGLLGWTGIARLVRAQILSEREKDYVLAAKALGLKERKIIVNHILPNIFTIVIVQATLGYASNLLTEAGLSFLGFGVVEPNASWGNMMTAAQSTEVMQFYWWRWVIPSMAIFLTALSVNLVGDALRDALDPKSQER